MNQVIEQIYDSKRVEDAEGTARDCFPLSIPAETGSFLYDLIRQQGCTRTLEVGMAYGLSTLHMAQALRDNGGGSHIAIDPRQVDKWGSIGLLNVKKAGLDDLVTFHEEPSHVTLPRLRDEGTRLDFAFIDGLHLFDYALVDFFFIDQMLDVGGVVCIDDLWMPGMRRVASFILKNRAYELITIASRASSPAWVRAARLGRRFLREPLAPDWAVKLIDKNVCALRKVDEDRRKWVYHRAF